MKAIHMQEASQLIKSMPSDQAIQQMKAKLSGEPETTKIDGELVVVLLKL